MITLGGYQVHERHYESSNSVVFKGVEEQHNRPVILKLLNRDFPTAIELSRFRQEYHITHSLELDGVIGSYGIKKYRQSLVMVLEEFGGESLARLLPSRTLSLAEKLSIAAKAAQTLGQIHQHNIVHKDINPSNIVWNPSSNQVKIIDFGISSRLSFESSELFNPNVLEGTLPYMSPEQTGRMNRGVDYRSDLYSFGVTLYELFTGNLPYGAANAIEWVHAHIAVTPTPPHQLDDTVPQVVSAIIMKLMSKSAEDRYQSADGLAHDLELCLREFTATGTIADFQTASRDYTERFRVPQKLYGREAEIEALLAAHARVALGAREMTLIAGYSGIGKTAVVREIHKPIVKNRGFFVSGKCDPVERNIPYSAFIQAFKRLIRQLLGEDEETISSFRDKVIAALRSNGRVIVDVIADLELLIGPQPAVAEQLYTEFQNRFFLAMRAFVQVFCREEHPLVIFLDDLQWADSASLKLMQTLMTDQSLHYLQLIGAYRDNEVDDAHPLRFLLEELRSSGDIVERLELSPLSLDDVLRLTSDALNAPSAEVIALAELVFQKTQGNPFFINQFLRALHEDGSISFDKTALAWRWDAERIRGMDSTGNVVDMMATKINNLPAGWRRLLEDASCLGSQFSLELLCSLHDRTVPETARALMQIVEEGLLVPVGSEYKLIESVVNHVERGDTPNRDRADDKALDDHELDYAFLDQVSFRFIHDRVQQAAYSLLDETERSRLHHHIGKQLLARTDAEHLPERVFDIVNQLNLGIPLLDSDDARAELARLNLQAGKKAKSSSAFELTLSYLETGIGLLSESSWTQQYDLTLALYVEATEAAFLNTRYDRMKALAEVALREGRTLFDKVRIHELMLQYKFAINKPKEAIGEGLHVLRLLKQRLPNNPGDLHILVELVRTRYVLIGRRLDDLQDIEDMTDPHSLAAVRILAHLGHSAYIAMPKLLPLVVLRGVSLSLEFGNAAETAFLFAAYGMILCGALGDIDRGYAFGQIALLLSNRSVAKRYTARTTFVVQCMIDHWKNPLRDSIKDLPHAYQVGVETGDVEYATLIAHEYCAYSYYAGKPLGEVYREMQAYAVAITKFRQEMNLNYHEIFRQTLDNLLEKQDRPWELEGTIYDASVMLPVHEESNDETAILLVHLNRMMLACLFGMYGIAVESSQVVKRHLESSVGLFHVPVYHFYDSLVLLGLCSEARGVSTKKALRRVRANQKKLGKWAKSAPENHAHKWHLVEAELHRVKGHDMAAIDHYDMAVKLAMEFEFVQEEALARELCALFWYGREHVEIAQIYMQQARHLYGIWGAKYKVQDIENKYPELLAARTKGHSRALHASLRTTSTSTGTGSERLDLISVTKAAQALSGEIEMDRLLSTLMRNVLENAGAQRGVLLVDKDGQWMVEAQGTLLQQAAVLQSVVAHAEDLPISIVNYVARTKENVVLDDAAREGAFMADDYIVANASKSVLCTPLQHKGRLSGILYLENTLATGAFTEDRLVVLNLLSSQAAVSIETARLYANLQDSERKYRALFSESQDAIFIASGDGSILDVNPAALVLFGYHQGEIRELNMAHFAPSPRDENSFRERILRDGAIYTHEVGLRTKDGSTIDCLVSASARHDEDGELIGFQGIIRDITERKRREEAERRLEAYRRSPVGRAEVLAGQLVQRPASSLYDLMDLAKAALSDPEAASLLGNLGQVLSSQGHDHLAVLVEGYWYIATSQSTPELTQVGLRTLIDNLDPSSAAHLHGAAAAQLLYGLARDALEAASLSQISAVVHRLKKSQEAPDGVAALADLLQGMESLSPIAAALHAYERVDAYQDRLAYLVRAVERLGEVDRQTRHDPLSAHSLIIRHVAQRWLHLVMRVIGELKTSARMVYSLVTRRARLQDSIPIVLSLRNDGRAAAVNLRVELLTSPDYRVLDGSARVELLAPGEEARVELRVGPHADTSLQQLRVRFEVGFDDPRGADQVEHFADLVSFVAASAEFQFIPNPYVVGTPLRTDSPLFFGREDVLASIEESLEAAHRNNLVLIGQRRMGKTSLLKQLQRRLSDAHLAVYIDGQALGLDPGLGSFFLSLATEIAFAMDDEGIEITPPEAEDFESNPVNAFDRHFLPQVFERLGSRHLLILLDEFEELEASVRRGTLDASIFGYLRHVIQHTERLSMIFCGTHRLEELAGDYWSVLFNICLYRHVGFLQREESERLVQQPVAPFGMQYDDLALEKIWRVTSGHPYFLQLLCHSLVNHHNQSKSSYITVADVNAALEEIMTTGEAHFVYLWTESTPDERLVLAVLSREMPLAGSSTAVQLVDLLARRQLTLERSAVSEAMRSLALREILQTTSGSDSAFSEAYQWRLGLLAQWVMKYKSIERTIEAKG